ncbi:hypothetical protein MN116_001460 [Schistosoma mekongi]|uniref:Uncharacterized protein n=1 Tax=Schistosoma mekongi TaxID=38744 RepID=A0AAE1ZLK9_SCHME|nr:hypothetical protein MN116_001460 [Schistosoma mekongi]
MDYLLPLCQGRIKPDELPVISPRTIYFFVCSAYIDFSLERRVLQESTYHDIRKYSLEKYGLDVCILLGQKYGLPLLPKRISSSTFDCIRHRIKQKTSNPYYRFIQDIDLSKWYYLNPNVLGEPEWNLNSMDYLGDKLENESLQDNLQAVTKHLVETLVNSNLEFENQKLKVLWRSPNGIDRKFHREYLLEFAERVKNLACNAIDRRASTKVALMLPSLSIGRLDSQSDEIDIPCKESVENGDMPHTVSTPVITLPQIQNRHTYLARELQKRIGLWDRVWNSINYAGWLIPVASSYKNEIETLLCYIEDVDPTAQVPMLVYSTCETTEKLDEEQFCLANAVAACSFQEIQSRVSTNPSDYLLLIRIFTNPVLITDALLDLAEQISLILQIEIATLNTTTLASFLYSLSCLHTKNTLRSIIIVIGGIEHLEVSEYQESMEGLLPILQAKQLPRRLGNGIKLILSGNLKMMKLKEKVESGEEAETEINGGILLPTTSLNLEVCSNGLSGGFTNCMHNLTKLNRCLTNEQLTCVHQLFQQIYEEKNLPILACAAGLCLLSDLPSQYMKRDDLVCKLIHTHLDDFIAYYGKYFCYQTVKHLMYLLISVSNKNLSGPGVTIHELQEMLSPLHELLLNQMSQQHLESNNIPVFDNACLLLLLHSIDKSLTTRLGPHNFICSVDGYFVYKLSTKNQLDQTTLNKVDSMLKGYFLNEWFAKRKDLASLRSYKTSFHSICFSTLGGSNDPEKENYNCDLRVLAFNVRYLRQLSFCLLNVKDYYEFSYRTTFCFDWLYGKIYSIGVKSVLDDLRILIDMLSSLDDESNFTENARAIRFESSIMQNILTQLSNSLYYNPDSLPTELLGYLVRFTSGFSNHNKQTPENEKISLIDLLVKECEVRVTKRSYLLPLYSYPLTPGSPLLGQITCPTPLLNLYNLHQNNNEWKFNSQILIKLKNNPVIYRYDCQQGREISCWKSSSGYLYLTPNGKYAIIIDEEKRDTLKIHQIDIDINGCVPLIGQINPGLWIKPIWTKNPDKETLKMQIIFLDITDDYVAFIVQTRNTRSFLNPSEYIDYLDKEKDENFNSNICDSINDTADHKMKGLVNKSIPLWHIPENLSAGTINHVVIFELTTGKPLHLISPTPCATLVKLVQVKKTNERTSSDVNVDGDNDSINRSCDLFFFNSADHLFGFHLKSGEQQFSIDLQFVPRKILVSNNNQRLFILDSNNPYVLQLLINKLGQVSKSFRTSYDDLITKDNIVDIKLSRYYSFLLVHAKKNVLVYDYANDAVFVHITRPAGIPREFRLPNSKYQNLVFTAVEFALNDQIVLAAIFRNILIWDVRQGVQLTTLTSSIGVISRLLVDPSEKQLIGYISTSKILNLWNLPLALANATLKQNSDINPISIHCDNNRMDCLTKPISQLIYSRSSHILLVTCYNSDELGVFDLSSGHLTDVFTHNGIVQSAVLSSCGKYALIGLVTNKQTEENANLIWDLSKRLIVVEYGNQVGFHVGLFKRCGSFLQLMPQLTPKNDRDSSQRYSYMILHVEIDVSNTGENKAIIKPVTSSKLPSIVPDSKPFMTSDDQHLIMQIESHEELKQGVNICQELALWSFDSSPENESVVQNGKLWYTHTEELKTLLTGNKEYDLHILNCAPVQNMSTVIIVTFAKFNSLMKSYLSVNWKTGSGLSKGMILAEIVKTDQSGQSKEWMLVILRSITGLNEWSSFQTLYYSFLKHELYSSATGHYYILPLGTKHVSQEYFKENVPHFTIQSKQSINSDSVKFHGYVLYDNLCIFSHRSTVYLVRPKSAKIITFIDVHHTITTINKNPVNDQCLFIGTADGYIISYCIISDNNDLNDNNNDNVLTLKQIHLNMDTRAVENPDRNVNFYSTQDNKNNRKHLSRTNHYLPYKHMKPDDFKLYQQCGHFGERRSQTCSFI